MNSYNLYLQDYLRGYREKVNAGERRRNKAFGFIVGSMNSRNPDKRINPKTGEIVWREEDKAYLRKVMNYRKMLVTQKVGDSFGALYDTTRYGALSKKKMRIPFNKEMRDTDLYGGFSSEKTVYAVLIESKKKDALGEYRNARICQVG